MQMSLKKNPTELAAISHCLKSSSLFGGLSEKELESLAAGAKLVYKKKGSVIYQKDDSSSYLYLINSGYVIESVFYGSSVDVLIKVRSTGEYFGEMGILSNTTYPNTAIALEDTSLVAINRTNFLETIWNSTSVCKVIIMELIERLNNSAQNMVNSMYLDASGRLAFTLVNLTTNNQNKCMNIRVTQSALAASAGMARQTAAKILGEWRRQGIISTERGRLCILKQDELLDIILHSEIEG